jgi:glycosyltransferase involved in cell wall biosynthesis
MHDSENTERPALSVIIPAYNEANYLPRTLEAVHRAMEQVDGVVEIIVSDNLSTDNTAAIAREYGARVVTATTKCIAAVRNTGAAAARGRVLVFCDADNRISPNLLASIQQAMQRGRYAGGGVANVQMNRLSIGTFLFNMLPLWCCAILLRTAMVVFYATPEAFEGVGGFDETKPMAEDYDFAQRLRQWGKARGLRYKNLYRGHVIVSTRKYDEHGDFFLIMNPRKLVRAIKKDQAVLDEFWYNPNR